MSSSSSSSSSSTDKRLVSEFEGLEIAETDDMVGYLNPAAGGFTSLFRQKRRPEEEKREEQIVIEDKKNKLSPACWILARLGLQRHQLLVIAHLLTHPGIIAAQSVGSGKTLLALGAILCLLSKDPTLRAIILTTATVRDDETFEKDLEKLGFKWSIFGGRVTVESHQGFCFKLEKDPASCPDLSKTFLVIDEAHTFKTSISVCKGKKDGKGKKSGKKAGDVTKGKRAKLVVDCAAKAFKVLLLTGTPAMNDVQDMMNLLAMVNHESAEQPQYRKKAVTEMLKDKSDHLIGKYFRCKISVFKARGLFPTIVEEPPQRIFMTPDYYKAYFAIEKKYYRQKEAYSFGEEEKKALCFYDNSSTVCLGYTDKVWI
jgi:hypothetical protein